MTSITNTRRLATAGLCAIAAATAASSPAQAATVQVDLGTGPILTVDTQAVQAGVGTLVNDVSKLRQGVVQRVQTTLQSTVRSANGRVLAPTSARVASVLRQTGVTAFAVVDGTGRVLRGPSALSVHSRRGILDIGWTNDFRGCMQVALTNTVVPQVLNVDLSMPLHTRVLTGRVASKASLRNITVAVVC
jgi:hypothetical protein